MIGFVRSVGLTNPTSTLWRDATKPGMEGITLSCRLQFPDQLTMPVQDCSRFAMNNSLVAWQHAAQEPPYGRRIFRCLG